MLEPTTGVYSADTARQYTI